MPTEYHGKVQIASKGFFYEGALAENDGFVNVNPWGTTEERLLASPSLTFTETIDKLIKNCTDCPLDPGELLLVDRWHLFMFMRCTSYGGDYSFPYKCSQCGSKEHHKMDLEKDLDVIYPDDPTLLKELGLHKEHRLEEPFEFILPVQGKTIKWRMMRGKDEHNIARYVTRIKNRRNQTGGSTNESDIAYIYRQALRIVAIDNVMDPPITDCIELIESLKGKDSLEWRNQTSSMNIGIEDTLYLKCSNCGWENESTLPVDKTFFRPAKRTSIAG